ncbi:hypothetical protein C1645_838806 [Glomus cerebriforme]|uniref:Uncharacterized protein n=1 Tax=Glomus cerebriforme TaxID=658196 RepID=A0A397SDC6_9GLOM|nr:hypothetical protein C1645_838806 [Glomus cerebriforme]
MSEQIKRGKGLGKGGVNLRHKILRVYVRGIDKPNIRSLARGGGFKRIIYEKTTKSYVGHDAIVSYIRERKNKSYRGFLESNREMIVTSIFSEKRHDLEGYRVFNFLKEAEDILNHRELLGFDTGTPGVLNSGAQTLLTKITFTAKHEQNGTAQSKKGKAQNVDNDDEKDIDSVNYESKEEQYNKELTHAILKLENVIKQNEVLQKAIKELRNENILLNKQIDVIEKTIGRDEYNNPVFEEFMRESKEQKLNDGFNHDWYGKDIQIRPCPDEFLTPWWMTKCQQ